MIDGCPIYSRLTHADAFHFENTQENLDMAARWSAMWVNLLQVATLALGRRAPRGQPSGSSVAGAHTPV
eukprot:862140-Prorocentrum_lima.AAC.1